MRRLMPVLIALGGCLGVGMLVGANRLTNGSGTTPPGAGGNPPPTTTSKNEGLVAKGRVVTEYEVLAIHLPAHMAAGKVQQVLVKNADAVKKGQVLVQFDAWQLKADLKIAENELQYALQKHLEAMKGGEQQKVLLEKADLAIQNAEQTLVKARELQAAVRNKLEIQFKRLEGVSNVEKAVRDEPDYLKAEGGVQAAENQVKLEKLNKQQIEKTSPIAEIIGSAVAKVHVAQETVNKAKEAIANCELKAEINGVVEHVAAVPGQVIYPQSQPLFYLIPEGPRYVNAEIAPDFAYKVRDKDGSKVIVSDDSNPGLTYEGTVEQIGSAFLPKAGGVDLLNGKSTYVLEVRIRVTDPAPNGKPPLRVNQPVRVTFP